MTQMSRLGEYFAVISSSTYMGVGLASRDIVLVAVGLTIWLDILIQKLVWRNK